MIKPFKLRVPNKKINEIYNKVKKYPWTNIQDMNGWEYGTNYNYLKNISRYWVTKFNWRIYLFFFCLGFLSKFLSKYLQNQIAWKFINSFIIIFMSILAFYVLLDIFY